MWMGLKNVQAGQKWICRQSISSEKSTVQGPGLPAATICHTHSKAAHMTGRLKQTHSHHALMCHYSLLDLCYMDVYLDFTIEPVNAA